MPFRRSFAGLALLGQIASTSMTAPACTGIRIKPRDGSVVYARTLEFGVDLDILTMRVCADETMEEVTAGAIVRPTLRQAAPARRTMTGPAPASAGRWAAPKFAGVHLLSCEERRP